MTILDLRCEIRFEELAVPPEMRMALRGQLEELMSDELPMEHRFFKYGHVLISYNGNHRLRKCNPTLDRLLSYGK